MRMVAQQKKLIPTKGLKKKVTIVNGTVKGKKVKPVVEVDDTPVVSNSPSPLEISATIDPKPILRVKKGVKEPVKKPTTAGEKKKVVFSLENNQTQLFHKLKTVVNDITPSSRIHNKPKLDLLEHKQVEVEQGDIEQQEEKQVKVDNQEEEITVNTKDTSNILAHIMEGIEPLKPNKKKNNKKEKETTPTPTPTLTPVTKSSTTKVVKPIVTITQDIEMKDQVVEPAVVVQEKKKNNKQQKVEKKKEEEPKKVEQKKDTSSNARIVEPKQQETKKEEKKEKSLNIEEKEVVSASEKKIEEEKKQKLIQTSLINGFNILPITIHNSTYKWYIYYRKETAKKFPVGRTMFALNLPTQCADIESIKQLLQTPDIEDIIFASDESPDSIPNSAHIIFKDTQSLDSLLKDLLKVQLSLPKSNIDGVELMKKEFKSKIITNFNELQDKLDKYMMDYDKRKLSESLEARGKAGVPDEDGFVLVTGKKGYSALTLEEIKRKEDEKKEKNFYVFQQRQQKKKELDDLRKKFEQDKLKIAKMSANRKFKPY